MCYADASGVHGGVITACRDHESVSRRVATDCAVSAGRCGCPASVNARLRRSSVGRRSVWHSHGGTTAHLLSGVQSLEFVVTSLY